MGLEDLPELGDTSEFCSYGNKKYYEYMNKDKPCYAEIAEITYNNYTPEQRAQMNYPGYSVKEVCYVFGKFDSLDSKGDSSKKCILVTNELWPSERCYFSWENGGPKSIPLDCVERYKTVKKFKRKKMRT